MRANRAATVCIAVGVIIGAARAQPDCGAALADYRAADTAGWTLTKDQSSALADRLLNDLATRPAEPCAARLLDAAIVAMGQCGRYGDAAMEAARALAAEPSADRRLLLANNFVGLRLKAANGNLDAAGMQECRAAAAAGLRGTTTERDCLDQGRLDYLSLAMPLHHVLASTEPTPQARLAALDRLVGVCDESVVVATAQGTTSPLLLDRYWMIGEAAREAGRAPDGSGDAMARWVRRVPWESGSHRNAGELLIQIVQDGNIPHHRRAALVAAIGLEMPDQSLRARAAYDLLAQSVRGLGASRDENEVAGVYDEVVATHALLDEIARAFPGGAPTGAESPRWDSMQRMTLVWMWDLGWKRLHRPEAGLAAAAEHVQKFPNSNPSPAMARFLADPAAR